MEDFAVSFAALCDFVFFVTFAFPIYSPIRARSPFLKFKLNYRNILKRFQAHLRVWGGKIGVVWYAEGRSSSIRLIIMQNTSIKYLWNILNLQSEWDLKQSPFTAQTNGNRGDTQPSQCQSLLLKEFLAAIRYEKWCTLNFSLPLSFEKSKLAFDKGLYVRIRYGHRKARKVIIT